MRKIYLIILVLFSLLLALSSILFYNYYYIKGYQTIDMYFEVSNELIGFNVDTDALYFGRGMPGTLTRRNLYIDNNYDHSINILIKIDGDIKPFVSVSKNDFIMQPGESTTVTYFVQTSKDTQEKNYTGVTTLVFTRPLFQ